jgi:threonine dehydrogenase-like Zn-dependent dehydrogenase
MFEFLIKVTVITMKQLVATARGKLSFLDYDDKPIKEDEVYVKVLYASPKHGSEIADFTGTSPFIKEKYDSEWQLFLPRQKDEQTGVVFGEWNVGNMIVGQITQKGNHVTEYEIGDVVCTYGGIRETHIVKAINNHRLLKVPKNSSWQNAVCYDPAQFALGGIRDGNVRPGDHVAIFGLGAIGQLAVQIAKHIGATVIAIDPIKVRRDIAAKHGAPFNINPLEVDTGFEIKKLTDKKGVDVIIETSGSKEALQHSLRGLAYGGTISYVAWSKEFGAGLDLGREAHYNNAKIIFSRIASEPFPDHPRWNRKRIEKTVWQMLTTGYLDCTDIIQPIVNFEEAAEAYTINVDQHPERSIKLGIRFNV